MFSLFFQLFSASLQISASLQNRRSLALFESLKSLALVFLVSVELTVVSDEVFHIMTEVRRAEVVRPPAGSVNHRPLDESFSIGSGDELVSVCFNCSSHVVGYGHWETHVLPYEAHLY